MKKNLQLFLLVFAFAGFAQAQGPASTARWFGYQLPPSPAEYKYISFTMNDLGSVSVASDVIPAVSTATFADGYVWSVNNDGGYNICRSSFDATNNRIEAPEVIFASVPYINDMAYNPADGLIYIITEEHLKCFNPANPTDIQDRGVIAHDGFNLATTPPALGNDLGGMVFAEFGVQTLTVPCGYIEAYQNSSWYDPYGMVGFYEFIEDCTAVAEIESVVTAVYPNPTYGKVRIEAENILNVSIFNILGEKVFEGSADGDAFEYDFSNQKAGIYLIKVETAKGVETTRVMVR